MNSVALPLLLGNGNKFRVWVFLRFRLLLEEFFVEGFQILPVTSTRPPDYFRNPLLRRQAFNVLELKL